MYSRLVSHVPMPLATITHLRQARVTELHQQSTCFRTRSCLRYLASSNQAVPLLRPAIILYGNGTNSCMSVEDSGKSYLRRKPVSTCNFSAQMEHPSGRAWVAGLPFLSSSHIAKTLRSDFLTTKITFLLHSSNAIACAISTSPHSTHF